MSLPGIGTPVRAGGKNASLWRLGWTYTDTGGAVELDTSQSDLHPDIATPVADSGTAGKTNIRFPKCTRVWVLGKSLEPPSGDLDDGTDYVRPELTEIDPAAGTAVWRMVDIEGSGDLNDPTQDARAELVLLLECV